MLASEDPCGDARGTALTSGRRVDRTYDARNRVTTLAFPDGRGNQAWTYTPDGLPSQITTNNSAGGSQVINTYTYNRRRLPETETSQSPGNPVWTLSTAYDPLGNVASQSYPSGLVVSFAPNALGQANQAGSYATGALYFPNGALKQFTYGNGIVHTMAQNARQLPASSIDTGGALSQQFGYDENGNVTAVTDALDAARSKAMVYDGLDRLTSASATVFGGTGVHQFAYDPLDNLRSWTLGGVKDQSNYVYGADNRLSQIKDTGGNVVHAFSHDPQGNVTTRNGIAHDFDFGNRLRSVNATESYLYDGHGRRVQTTQPSGSVTRWMYASSGQMLFSAKGPSNPTTHENVYLAGSLVAIIDRDGPSNAVTATTYQHTDALGSPVAMSNEAGAIIERTNYDPYGGPIGKTVNGLGYTGHVMDGATGLTYMQQRYYDQGVGRFLSMDPVTADASTGANFNRYWYANSNPFSFWDPDGRCAESESNRTCITSSAEATGDLHVVATSEQVELAAESAADYVVSDPAAKVESLGSMNRQADGSLKSERMENATTTYKNGDATASDTLPSNAEAGIHGHLVGQGLTDKANSLGDMKTVVRSKIPVFAIASDGRIAVSEVNNGRPQIRATRGEFTAAERRHYRREMNRRQRALNEKAQ